MKNIEGYFGYETRSSPAAMLMLLGDCAALWRRPQPFSWDSDVVISSIGELSELVLHLPLIDALVTKAKEEGVRSVKVALRPEAVPVGQRLGWDVFAWEPPQTFEKIFTHAKGLPSQIPLWIDLTGDVFHAATLKHSGVQRLAARTSRGGRNWIDHPLPQLPYVNEYDAVHKLAAFFRVSLENDVYARLLKPGPGDRPAPAPVPSILLDISGTRWQRWPLSYFAQLVSSLPEHHFTLVGKRDALLRSEHALLNEMERNRRVVSLLDQTTILELFSLVANARAVVTSDTETHHVANVYEVPGVVIFGPEVAEVWSPQATSQYTLKHGLRILQDHSCQFFPCNYRARCHQPDDWCMTKVRPEQVQSKLLEEINRHQRELDRRDQCDAGPISAEN